MVKFYLNEKISLIPENVTKLYIKDFEINYLNINKYDKLKTITISNNVSSTINFNNLKNLEVINLEYCDDTNLVLGENLPEFRMISSINSISAIINDENNYLKNLSHYKILIDDDLHNELNFDERFRYVTHLDALNINLNFPLRNYTNLKFLNLSNVIVNCNTNFSSLTNLSLNYNEEYLANFNNSQMDSLEFLKLSIFGIEILTIDLIFKGLKSLYVESDSLKKLDLKFKNNHEKLKDFIIEGKNNFDISGSLMNIIPENEKSNHNIIFYRKKNPYTVY